MNARLMIGLAAIVAFAFTSCVSRRALQDNLYFRDISDSLLSKSTLPFEQKLQAGDILYIGVITTNETSSMKYNQPNVAAGGGQAGTTGGPIGYLIDNEGSIVFPELGRIKVAGLTKQELTDTLTEMLKPELTDPIVSVRLLNYKITILGEVKSPGSYNIPNERVNILDALGMAGDITFYGRKDSIMVVRQIGDQVETGSLNLNKGDIFNSPYFYLQQNDVVYVKMTKRKLANSDQATLRSVSLGIGILSAITILITTFVK